MPSYLLYTYHLASLAGISLPNPNYRPHFFVKNLTQTLFPPLNYSTISNIFLFSFYIYVIDLGLQQTKKPAKKNTLNALQRATDIDTTTSRPPTTTTLSQSMESHTFIDFFNQFSLLSLFYNSFFSVYILLCKNKSYVVFANARLSS